MWKIGGVLFVFLALAGTVHAKRMKMLIQEELMDFGTNIGGSYHPCFRSCDGSVMRCEYNMSISPYTSLSIHCGDCPWVAEDCRNPGCITAGGTSRPVHVANLMLPGPPIYVCYGDEIVVRVENAFENEGATIHWHGQWMEGTQFMDGVPYISQCPIQPNNAFVYEFKANPAGTHMWHAHIGFMDSDGLFGPIVVRQPASEDPHYALYDEDLPEHVVMIWHWYPHLTADYLPARLDRNQTVSGAGLIINGKGAIQPVRADNGSEADAPMEEFYVEQGKRYRFRLIFNSAVYCPVHLSIDNHTLVAIAADGANFAPVQVDSLMLNAGERWDVVLAADQAVSTYWIRLQALGDCGSTKTRVHQQAVLRYHGSTLSTPPSSRPSYTTSRAAPGKILNPMQVVSNDYSLDELIHMTNLTSIDKSKHGDISSTPDRTIYLSLNFKYYNELTSPGPYPQMNNVSFEFPTVPMLLRDGSYCTKEDASNYCIGTYCSCPYAELIKLDELVEIVIVDLSTDRAQDHPYHMHGSNFHVVAEGTIGADVSLERVQTVNGNDGIAKKFAGALLKDTVSVPSQGYVVIRFRATNPGYWFFHCHIANHLHLGMGMVLRVGEHTDLPATPSNFPSCGDFVFSGSEDNGDDSSVAGPPSGRAWLIALALVWNALLARK